MNNFTAALWAETLKVRRSRIAWLSAIAFSLGPLIGGLFMFILKDPELARSLGLLGAKAQLLAGTADWPTYLGILDQAAAIGGLFVFGFVAVWVFGREYSDRTMKDLLALPTPRWAIVAAKFSVVVVWCTALAAGLYALGLAVGAAVDIPQWSQETALNAAGNFAVTSVLTIALITPVCFVTNVGRGYLSPLAFVILMLALAQVIAILGWGGYFPWSVPGLHSGMAGAPAEQLNPGSYVIVALTSLAGFAATFVWWNRADQTR
jgi:ABC-2 type transport system permease protein